MAVRGNRLRGVVRRAVPLVLATAVLGAVCTNAGRPPAAFASTTAPAGFSNAVQNRIFLLRKQIPFDQAGLSFADLQNLVGNTAASSGLPVVVDPDTAQPWVLSTLLREASGQSTWLDDTASDDAREQQISAVLALMTWRLAYATPQNANAVYGQDYITALHEDEAPQASSPSITCDYDSTLKRFRPSSALTSIWQSMYPTAIANPTDNNGSNTASSTAGEFFNGTEQVYTVSVGRELWQGPLPAWGINAPLSGYPIDKAKVLVQKLYSTAPDPTVHVPLTVLGGAVAAGQGMTQSDWDFNGSTLTTAAPTLTGPYTQYGYYQLDAPVQPSMLLAPGADPNNPTLAPEFRVQIRGPEPESDFGADGPGMNSVSSSGCTWYEGWGSNGINILYREQLPPVIASGQVSMSSATLDFDARAQRRQAALTAQVVALQTQRTQLEESLLSEQSRSDAAMAKAGDLAALSKQIDTALNDVVSALSRLRNATPLQSPNVRSLLDNDDAYAERIFSLQQQIIDTARRGGDTTALTKQLNNARVVIAAIDSRLTALLRGTAEGSMWATWTNRLRTLEAKSFAFHLDDAKLLAVQGDAEEQITQTTDQLSGVYHQLLDLAERLAGFDPEVSQVDVAADGTHVFNATATVSYTQLRAVNAEIAKQEQLIATITTKKKAAFGDFYAAEKSAIDSQRHLAEVLLDLGYARFATDLAFDSFDVVKATAKGGVVGAAAELGSKLLQKWVKEMVPEPSGIDPNSEAALINQEFDAGLKDAWSSPRITRVVGERVVKDTVIKGVKDGMVNQYIGQWLFKNIEFPARQFLQDSPVLPGQLSSQLAAFTLKIHRVSRLQTQLKNLQKGYLSNFATMPKFKDFLKGTAENFAKDALKTIIKGGLDKVERDAWHDFFVKESLARSFYTPYHDYADMWEQALTREDELLATRATMLKGADPRGGFVTQLSTPFDRTAQVQITLTVSGFRDPSDPIQVFIGGAQASEVGTTDTYTADLTNAQPDANNRYTIVLK